MTRTASGTTAALVVAAAVAALSMQAALAQEPTPDNRPSEPPPQAINCVRPFAERTNTALNPAGPLEVELRLDERVVVLTLPTPPSGITCYAIYREPVSIYHANPLAFDWDEIEVPVPANFRDSATFGVPGENCYKLFYGSPAGLSEPVVACIDVPDSIVPPTPTQPNFPTPPAPGYYDVLPPEVGTGAATESVSSNDAAWLLGILLALAGGGLAAVARLRRPQHD